MPLTPTERTIKAWRLDPVRFVRECFQVEPDAWQVDTLRAFASHQRIAMKSSKGVGKSTVLAWCLWNFLLTRPHPKIACTSITGDNLSDGLWTELAKWQHKSPLLKETFEWTKTRIFAKESPETWWCSARTWPRGGDTTQQADTLAGLHADYLLFVLDEVGGIPDAVMAAAEAGLASGIESKLLIAGNPTHNEGPLYRAVTSERHLWHVVEITSDPDDPKRSPRVSVQWARDQIAKYGADSPWVLVNVFGRFPPTSLNALLGPDEVSTAMRRHLLIDQYDFAAKTLGVDVARFGDDRTVLFPRQGLACFQPEIMRNARTEEIVGRIAKAVEKWQPDAIFVDGTGGYGAGVIDGCLLAGMPVIEVQFAGKPTDPRFLNRRVEMWWEMAEWIKRGGALPNNPDLQRELTAPTYWYKGDKIQLESKDEIKARIGDSPDLSDALALTFAQTVFPKSFQGSTMGFNARALTEYDPYAKR